MRDSGRAAVGTYRQLWRGLRDAAGAVSRSEIGGKLKLLVGGVLVLLVGINGLNVLGSYVGGYAMTAVEGDFSHALSLGEQQLLAIARVLVARPAFVVLHNPGTTLAPEQLALALRRLGRAGVTYVTFGASEPRPGSYDAVLELHAGGAWSFRDRRQTHLVLPDIRVVSS